MCILAHSIAYCLLQKKNDPLRAFRGTATAYMMENYQTYFGPAVVVRKGGAVTESWPRARSAILGSREARTEYWLWLLTCWLLAFGCELFPPPLPSSLLLYILSKGVLYILYVQLIRVKKCLVHCSARSPCFFQITGAVIVILVILLFGWQMLPCYYPIVKPSPATHAILRRLKAGERVFQTFY